MPPSLPPLNHLEKWIDFVCAAAISDMKNTFLCRHVFAALLRLLLHRIRLSRLFICFDQRTYLYEVVPAIDFYARTAHGISYHINIFDGAARYGTGMCVLCCLQQNDGMMIEKSRKPNAPTTATELFPCHSLEFNRAKHSAQRERDNANTSRHSKSYATLVWWHNRTIAWAYRYAVWNWYTKHRINWKWTIPFLKQMSVSGD